MILSFVDLSAQELEKIKIDPVSEAMLRKIETTNQDTTKLRILKELVDINLDVKPQLAANWIQKGITISLKNHDTLKQIAFQLQQLRVLNQQGKFKETIEEATQLEFLVKKHGTPHQQAARLMSLGNASQRLGLYDSAAKIYNNVITISRISKLKEIELTAAMNIGILLQYQNRNIEMKQQLLKTLELAQLYNLMDNIPMIKFNLSNAEARLNNFGKSIEYLFEIIPHYTLKNNQYALGLAYANLSWCYFKSEKISYAIEYARKSYQIRTVIKDNAGLAHLNLNFSKFFLGLGKLDSANFYAQNALKMSSELHLINDIRDNYETLFLINERKGDYSAALKFNRLYYDWRDSVNNIEKVKLVEQEFQKLKRDSLADFKKVLLTAEQQKTKVQQWNMLLIGASCILVFFSIFFYLKSKKSSQTKLSGISNSISNQMDDNWRIKYFNLLTQTNIEKEQLQKEHSELKMSKIDFESRLTKHESTDVNEIRKLIDSDKLHSDGYWNEFMLLFSKIYPEFFRNIKASFPELTQHELRICALIKLNHGVLDTAKVLNITVDSARKARYRLYKKMNLTNDQELVDHIIKL